MRKSLQRTGFVFRPLIVIPMGYTCFATGWFLTKGRYRVQCIFSITTSVRVAVTSELLWMTSMITRSSSA